MDRKILPLPFEIKENGCKLVEWLGKGSYGNVYKATKYARGKNLCFAFKEYKTSEGNLGFDKYGVGVFESVLLETLKHPNILTSYGSLFCKIQDEDRLFISMPLITPLKQKLYFAPEENLLRWYRELLSGMCYLETNGLYHGDIKPENLGVGQGGVLKIFDFSLASPLSEVTVCSTLHYRSPKFLLKYLKDGGKDKPGEHFENAKVRDVLTCNMWSFGITVLCILAKKNDFYDVLCPKVTSGNCDLVLGSFYENFCVGNDRQYRLDYAKKITGFANFENRNHFQNILDDMMDHAFNLECHESPTFRNFIHKGRFLFNLVKPDDEGRSGPRPLSLSHSGSEFLFFTRFLYHFLKNAQVMEIFPIIFEMAEENSGLIESMNSDPGELTALFLNLLRDMFHITDFKFQRLLKILQTDTRWLKNTYFDFYNRISKRLWVKSFHDRAYSLDIMINLGRILSGNS